MRPYWLVGTLTVMIAACATRVPSRPVTDPTIAKLQATADEVSQSLRQLAETQQAAKPVPPAYPVPQSGPLAQAITLSWAGPPEPVLRLLADMIGYEFRAIGKPPLAADVVTIEARRLVAWSVLEDIGWQLGTRATVVVNEGHREIQLIYVGQQP
jgi:defect-in-organelle-trafficking protein DotD